MTDQAESAFDFYLEKPSKTLSKEQANFSRSGLKRTCKVGSYPPNRLGLYDMHGNVWQWCQDWRGEDYYSKSPAENPEGPAQGTARVLRGGSWRPNPGRCRSACRGRYDPADRYSDIGFRVVVPALRTH